MSDTLFDDTLTPVHRYDGMESRHAARRVDGAAQFRQVMVCLADADRPLTDDEIAERCGLLRHSAGTRRGVAVRRGFVRKSGRGVSRLGNPAAQWVVTDAGRAWVADLAKASS